MIWPTIKFVCTVFRKTDSDCTSSDWKHLSSFIVAIGVATPKK